MTDPNIIFDHDLVFVAALGIPHIFSDNVKAMIVGIDECHVRSNQYLVANFCITQKSATIPNPDLASEDNMPMWRPEGG